MEELKKSADEMLQKKPPKLLKQLISELDYLDESDFETISKAYAYSSIAHEHQSRKTGEPYIIHPVAVASILGELHLDAAAISAGLLHDVLEDTKIDERLLREEFGEEIFILVDGVSKLDKLEDEGIKENQAESFRKMMLAMVQDIRVIIIKLSDRLHNMRTIYALDPHKQMKKSKETLEIFAPIANRLGIYNIRRELEKEGFKYGYPYRHKIISYYLKKRLGNQKKILKQISKRISKRLEGENIRFKIVAREKELFSVYEKMKRRHLPLEQIIDVYGLRIIVDEPKECYQALGLVHELYKPIMGKFKDYIAIPRVNGYQSIHTSLLGPNGTPIEIQIRTLEMDRVAENGIAAHWKYKATNPADNKAQSKAREWLATIQEIQGSSHPEEFLESVKVDLYPDKVYVFSPSGDIFRLPSKSTCVDFAYAVHTDVGNSCIGAKINRVQVPLRSVVESGQTVEIITSRYANPDPSWLSFVTTAKARHNLRSYLRDLNVEQTMVLGKRLFGNALDTLGKKQRTIKSKQIKRLLELLNYKDMNELYQGIGAGDRNPLLMAQMMLGEDEIITQTKSRAPILIKGTEGVSIEFAKCCMPIPGDTIIGHLSKVRGFVIHRRKCRHTNSFQKDRSRWIGAEWSKSITQTLPSELLVNAKHKPGALAAIAAKLAERGCNIEQVTVIKEHEDDTTDFSFQFQVADRIELADVIRDVRSIGIVESVSRGLH
ncbi:MAG: bifunctional (p)ppGpp synthetase/guanosine-3',5'-bis(diphosphate) 3'-pyrophosphohydrolase [Candidatus Thioglobus sp.]|jgi:RelA/SpoT family (p)ppGpp synthetase|nr:bifunctional GTP diphosphokinase/guanosine-3',5'-bis(diphosphate) 3'-diphosphatase [Gammaproteobacteria bacterium]MBQ09841.1 bifunctional GTP diphosphokinase/guanosine-3',5'-bis(diphosphate) 3'-diphosphatase [Gammaproteobacteria bacterium]MDP6163082.1 bifunctional (p)ppGpp synthetase/guanosine-3',5'-bis(diphosphate) 3'-pyrophosphohydrolase [Candidatus Thioglobus sp.]HJL80818.1 bifunctional (p)ppGpp synthetase/guanosine-3',5'-bis(diphosphate) 3'-pyrophosphohydrolase [Gammaproteobacteria bacter|tara:strand:+ start:19638 stop:21791 length:2154 start_codon:yes stop_codon:yes gene_type:complete